MKKIEGIQKKIGLCLFRQTNIGKPQSQPNFITTSQGLHPSEKGVLLLHQQYIILKIIASYRPYTRIMTASRLLEFFFFIFLLCASTLPLMAQPSNIGLPPIHRFDKKTYNAGNQNWDFSQSSNGMMMIANDGGLLSYDGVRWFCQGVSNRTIVRSVLALDDGRVFIGAQGEMGVFHPTPQGLFDYHPITLDSAQQYFPFADVWDIEEYKGDIFFRSFEGVFKYNPQEGLKVVFVGGRINFLDIIDDTLWIQTQEDGLWQWTGKKFILKHTQPAVKGNMIIEVLPYQGQRLLVTRKSGLWRWTPTGFTPFSPPSAEWQSFVSNDAINCATHTRDSALILGTTSSGVWVIDPQGRIKYHFDLSNGLQKNNIQSLHVDRAHNIWVGVENGIDYIEYSAPIRHIRPDSDLQATGYTVQLAQSRLFFGTSNGVYQLAWQPYYTPDQHRKFQLINSTEGQVWNIDQAAGQVYVNHHEGILKIQDTRAQKLNAPPGAWMQIPLAGSDDLYLSGHYKGLSVLRNTPNGWQLHADLSTQWAESCRIMAQDALGNIWVSHPYRGVYKVKLSSDFKSLEQVKLYNQKHGFPSDLQIYVFKVGEDAVFCAERGVYRYNEQADTFELHPKWSQYFPPDSWVKRLTQDAQGNIWFVEGDQVGRLQVQDGGVYKDVQKEIYPILSERLVGGFEHIYPVDDQHVFFATEDGFLLLYPQAPQIDTALNVFIRHIATLGENAQLTPLTSPITLPYRQNALRFEAAATTFSYRQALQFQYRLRGFEDAWSTWTSKAEKEYTNLPPGIYTIEVRARNRAGQIVNAPPLTLRILPPWYASQWALTAYAIILAIGLFSMIAIPRKRFAREKAALQSQQAQTLQEKEREHQRLEAARLQQIDRLEREKLELQIQAKNQELASTTMHLVQKSEVLQKLRAELQGIIKATKDQDAAQKLKKVLRLLAAEERLDEDWEQFAQHFDEVHSNFLQRLREQYPQLTPKDHRLCAYLRMNLTSKEIAPLMNISVRGVEIARYRLRKKLELDAHINLVEWILHI